MDQNQETTESSQERAFIDTLHYDSPESKDKTLLVLVTIGIVAAILLCVCGMCGTVWTARSFFDSGFESRIFAAQETPRPRFPETEVPPLLLDQSHTQDSLTIEYPSSWEIEDWLGVPGGFIISEPKSNLLIFASSEVFPVSLNSRAEITASERFLSNNLEYRREGLVAEFTTKPIRYENEGTLVVSIGLEVDIGGVPSKGFLTDGLDGELYYSVYSHVPSTADPELFATLQAVVESITLTPPKPVEFIPLSGTLTVHYIDVGHGDSAFIELPNNQTLLIDAGSHRAGSAVVSYIEELGYSSIDYLVASNTGEEHVGGIPVVLEALHVGEVWAPILLEPTDAFERFLQAVEAEDMLIHPAQTGQKIVKADNLAVDVLAPMPADANAGHNHDDFFNYDYEGLSAIIEVTFGGTTFLFTGDTSRVLTHNAAYGSRNEVDVLKVGNHGSAAATDADLIETLSPSFAVISVGEKAFGYPADSVLKALSSVRTYRTDAHGTVVFTSNGKRVSVEAPLGSI